MFHNKVLFLIAALTAFLFVSCSDDPSSIGADLLNSDKLDVKVINSFDDSLSQQSSFLERKISLGASPRLLVGKTNDIEAVTLLRFNFISLAESLKTAIKNSSITIASATVKLTPNYTFNTNSTPFDFSIHKINSRWSSAGFTSDSLNSLSYDQTNAASNLIVTDSIITFDIDKQVVMDWLLAEADTSIPVDNGMFLKPESVSGIRGFQAVYSANKNIPQLNVTLVTANSDTAVVYFTSTADISVVSGTLPVMSDHFFTQSGLIVNSKFWCNISTIPATALINNATFSINVDTLLTQTGSTYNIALGVGFITDTTKTSIDSSGYIVLSRTGNTFSGNITRYVQRWADGETNLGILIWNLGQLEGAEKFVFFGSSYSDRNKQPKLEITYTYKKSL